MKSALNLASIDMQHDDISTTLVLGPFWSGHLQKSPAVANFRLPKKSEKNQGFLLHEQDPECGAARWKLDILVFWNALHCRPMSKSKSYHPLILYRTFHFRYIFTAHIHRNLQVHISRSMNTTRWYSYKPDCSLLTPFYENEFSFICT